MTTTRKLPTYGISAEPDDKLRKAFLEGQTELALKAIDCLHGAICELEDARLLGDEERILCESVFHRAQELCGHKAFRQ